MFELKIKTLYSTTYQTILPIVECAWDCEAITKCLLGHYFNVDITSIILGEHITISSQQHQLLTAAIERLKEHEPIQYILETAHFLGRDFQVSPAVLIPRPETEFLVQSIIEENSVAGLGILDIGTGSGCIAVSLQQELTQATVHGLEVDPAALATAKVNAKKLGATVQFIQADILQDQLPPQRWDIIVSNPPYVRMAERGLMQRCVLEYEPAKALFVPDQRPLIFYERIIALAPQHLKPAGKIYLEINEAFGGAVADLLIKAGFQKVRVMQDLNNKDRWVAGSV